MPIASDGFPLPVEECPLSPAQSACYGALGGTGESKDLVGA